MLSLFHKAKKKAASLCYVSFLKTGISIAVFDNIKQGEDPSKRRLQHAAFLDVKNGDEQNVLAAYLEKHQLSNLPCHYILSPSDYRLLVLDAPNVPLDEMKSAARWLVKDLIDFPLDDAAVEVFPAPVRHGQSPKIYIAITHLSRLQFVASCLDAVGLDLASINVSELALRNLLTYLPNAKQGVALLYAGLEGVRILIVKGCMIFLERQIAAQAHALTTNLILEVQRSLDFYQTQMGIAAPVQLYLDPFFGKDEAMVNQLSTELTMPVKVLTLSDFFTFGKEFAPSKEAHMISVLGAALQAAPLEGELCQFIDFSQGLPKKQRLYLPVKMMLWLWGVLLAVLIGFSMISAVQNNVLKRQIKKVQVETQNLSDQLLKISRVYADAAKKVSTDKELAQLKSEVNIKTKILDELKKLIAQNKPSFSMDLTYFAQKIVPDVWLTAISLQTQGDVVNLRGSAFDVDSILTFTDRLNQLSLFQDNPLHVVFLERVKTPQIQMNFILSTREAPHA